MLDVIAEITRGKHIVAFLALELWLARHTHQGYSLSYIGERIGHGFAGFGVDGRDQVGTRYVGLTVPPYNVVLVLEPVFELFRAAVYGDCAPIIACLVIVVLAVIVPRQSS